MASQEDRGPDLSFLAEPPRAKDFSELFAWVDQEFNPERIRNVVDEAIGAPTPQPGVPQTRQGFLAKVVAEAQARADALAAQAQGGGPGVPGTPGMGPAATGAGGGDLALANAGAGPTGPVPSGYNALRPTMLKAAAAAGVPAAWVDSPAFITLINKESGWRPNAQNPTSTAYGLFQFLDATWGGYGVAKTSDPYGQAIAGFRYIKARYGTPEAALAFHNSHNWY